MDTNISIFLSLAPYGENFTLPFTSPDYPLPLPPNTTWTYSLPVEEGLTTIFTFYEFDLVENVDFYGFGCGFDPTDPSQFVVLHTGDEILPPIVVNCTSVWVRLQTGATEGVEDTRGGYTGEIFVIKGEGKCSWTVRNREKRKGKESSIYV